MFKFTIFIILIVIGMYLLFVDSSLTEYIYEKKRKFNTQRIERRIIKCFYSSDELNLTTVYNVDIDSIRNLLNECGYLDAEIKQIKSKNLTVIKGKNSNNV